MSGFSSYWLLSSFLLLLFYFFFFFFCLFFSFSLANSVQPGSNAFSREPFSIVSSQVYLVEIQAVSACLSQNKNNKKIFFNVPFAYVEVRW